MSTPNQPTGGRPDEAAGGKTPPWKDAPRPRPATGPNGPGPVLQPGPPVPPTRTQQMPQSQPQTNLQSRPGRPSTYVPPAGADERVRAAGREEAKTKAAVIDGPTRNIARSDLPTDMPDLSSVRHPMPEPVVDRAPAAAPAVVAVPNGDPLRATVQLRRFDPWSAFKVAGVIAVVLFFVWMVAVGVLYAVLDGMGVWDRLNNAFTDIVSNSGDSGLVSAGQIFGYAAGIGLINVVLFTAIATVSAFIYNLCSDLVGGLEVTLADRD